MVAFNAEYIIATLGALLSAYLIQHGSPNISPYITYLIVPMLVAYLIIQIINNVYPGLNRAGSRWGNYIEDKALESINNTGYMQIFPPMFIVLIIFALLLYNRFLG